MINGKEKLKEEVDKLLEVGIKLCDGLRCYSDYGKKSDDKELIKNTIYFITNYEQWYSKALVIIKQLLPDRYQDFIILYKNDKRKQLDYTTYTIFDALNGITSDINNYSPTSALKKLVVQVNILKSARDRFESSVYDIKQILQADVFDSEIESSKYLLKNGFLRAAGAICGVIIEKHFLTVCNEHNITIGKKNPSISDYYELLKKEGIIDITQYRFIQLMADYRNLCDHNKEVEPKKDQVMELIDGTDKIIKTVY